MKYRSPSPNSSLPTPPRSPGALEANKATANLLDSLTAFYQQERYWIHHTRASLEIALAKGVDAQPTQIPDSPSPSSSVTSSPDSDTLSAGAAPIVKVEPSSASLLDSPPSSPRKALWMRRKAGMKLKLENLAPQHRRRRPHRAPPSEPGARLLEMFSELVDARMESCQRISRLVRDTRGPANFIC
ncbi:hypothetical protein NLI96_g694 [Meripilus lineatus]|uniref:Uncharacterized protein n=1 Tax=Meripilus lineatus TaxID=2056292 RepID=A0AAD5VBV2_9APHY|nr:hypothetical protein NLI96_g694 [Physisporinus lineatus]